MAIRERVAQALANAFLAGPWNASELISRGQAIFVDRQPRQWLSHLVEGILRSFPEAKPRPIARNLQFIISQTTIPRSERVPQGTRLRRPIPWPGIMHRIAGPPSLWPVPSIVSIGDLAERLGLSAGELEWFANCHGWTTQSNRPALTHYPYQWIRKPSGGLRLLESPKPRLKQIQRWILKEILGVVPPHPAAHAFRTGRSISSLVGPHQSQPFLLHIDLREFFPSIHSGRINAIFRTMGYPEQVARILTGLCTNRVPSGVLNEGLSRLDDEWRWLRLRGPHLPQGAPTSPALSNLCARHLDARLEGLAVGTGAQYSRYADDLLFSGTRDLQRGLTALRLLIHAIILDEGFEIRHRKTRVMTSGTAQRVAGIQLNHHPNMPRAEFDDLKALLHNCRRFGPDSQNRAGHPRFKEHLQGRLAYWSAICPSRIMKLQRIFDEINWS